MEPGNHGNASLFVSLELFGKFQIPNEFQVREQFYREF
jgi:hypothetical protein